MNPEYNMVEFMVVCGYCQALVAGTKVRNGICPVCKHHVDEYMHQEESQ